MSTAEGRLATAEMPTAIETPTTVQALAGTPTAIEMTEKKY
jgi:hypothetical protein